jgi:RNA recognition motif-containing protein
MSDIKFVLTIKNLPHDIEENELKDIFSEYGSIHDVFIQRDLKIGSKTFYDIVGDGYVEFCNSEDCIKAYNDAPLLRGKKMIIEME